MELFVVCILGAAAMAAIIIQGIYCGFFCFYPLAPGERPLIGFRSKRVKLPKKEDDMFELEVPLEKVSVESSVHVDKEKESQTDV